MSLRRNGRFPEPAGGQPLYGTARRKHPAVIPDEQMDRFRFMLDYSPEAVEMCSAPLAPSDAVKVIKGPLAGLEGEPYHCEREK